MPNILLQTTSIFRFAEGRKSAWRCVYSSHSMCYWSQSTKGTVADTKWRLAAPFRSGNRTLLVHDRRGVHARWSLTKAETRNLKPAMEVMTSIHPADMRETRTCSKSSCLSAAIGGAWDYHQVSSTEYAKLARTKMQGKMSRIMYLMWKSSNNSICEHQRRLLVSPLSGIVSYIRIPYSITNDSSAYELIKCFWTWPRRDSMHRYSYIQQFPGTYGTRRYSHINYRLSRIPQKARARKQPNCWRRDEGLIRHLSDNVAFRACNLRYIVSRRIAFTGSWYHGIRARMEQMMLRLERAKPRFYFGHKV